MLEFSYNVNDTLKGIPMDAVLAFAKNLLNLHSFQNWNISVEESDLFAGKTVYSRTTIVLNSRLATLAEEKWKDIVIHEIAHVRAGQFCEAHGERWKSIACAMGGTGSIKV
jgi:predicted SprT family Zn-dependent metalloprotease